MNTHEAIKILRNTAWLGTNEDREKTEQAIEVVAEALEQEPSCRNTRQVDLISRQDAIAALDDIRYTDRQDWWAVLSTVENLPSVQPNPFCALADRECPFQGKEFAWCLTCPHISEEDRVLMKKVALEPKRGKWVQAKDVEIEYAVCTNCTHHGEFYMRYCPNCGADMRGDEN